MRFSKTQLGLLILVLGTILQSVQSTPSSDTNQNRKKCLSTDAYGLCTLCSKEFFLEDNLCYLCSNSCKLCADRNRCAKCFDGYRLDANGKCIWQVFDLVVYSNMAFGLIIVAILLFGAICSFKSPLPKILAGDDFEMPASSKSTTPNQSIGSLQQEVLSQNMEDPLIKSRGSAATNRL